MNKKIIIEEKPNNPIFPWAISLGNIGSLGFISMMIFLFILTIGFIYEWKKGALDWE